MSGCTLDVEPMTAEWTLLSSKLGSTARTVCAAKVIASRLRRRGPDMRMTSRIEANSYHQREPRIALRCQAVLVEEDGCALDVVITDVSREGFKLESHSELEVGSDVWLHMPKSTPVRGSIRWTCGHEAGGVFLEPVAL
jgi:hypothetical protein